MCRWLAYTGSPVLLEDLLFKPENSLVVQSTHSRLGVEPVNGDAFGVGWYGAKETPGIYHSTDPAWNDRNLRELSAHASAGRTSAHPRIHRLGGPADRLSSLPQRPLALDAQRGHLRLHGCEARPGLGRRARPLPGDRGIDRLRALLLPRPDVRACRGPAESGGPSRRPHRGDRTATRSLSHRTEVSTLRAQYPDNPVLHKLSDDARLVVSEPLGDLRGAWREVPESTCVVVRDGREELHEFSPTQSTPALR